MFVRFPTTIQRNLLLVRKEDQRVGSPVPHQFLQVLQPDFRRERKDTGCLRYIESRRGRLKRRAAPAHQVKRSRWVAEGQTHIRQFNKATIAKGKEEVAGVADEVSRERASRRLEHSIGSFQPYPWARCKHCSAQAFHQRQRYNLQPDWGAAVTLAVCR